LSGTARAEKQALDYLCPSCKARNSIQVTLSVDAVDVPAVEGLLDGTLFEFRCTACSSVNPMDHSVQFIDTKQAVCFRYAPQGDPLAAMLPEDTAWAEYSLRAAPDMNAFRELVHVWRDSLDNASMLLLKHMLAARVLEDSGSAPVLLSFDARVNMDGAEWLEYVLFQTEESDPETVRTPIGVYHSLAEVAAPAGERLWPRGQWADWDERSAAALWEAVAATGAK
jgi:hypothetical protein